MSSSGLRAQFVESIRRWRAVASARRLDSERSSRSETPYGLTYATGVPSTVADIFAAANTSPTGIVRWGTPPFPPTPRTAPATGIYVVALTDGLDVLRATLATAPISEGAVGELLAARPEMTLDRVRPTSEQLIGRLAAWWFPDEVVLYIGLAGRVDVVRHRARSQTGSRSTTTRRWAPTDRTPGAGH